MGFSNLFACKHTQSYDLQIRQFHFHLKRNLLSRYKYQTLRPAYLRDHLYHIHRLDQEFIITYLCWEKTLIFRHLHQKQFNLDLK